MLRFLHLVMHFVGWMLVHSKAKLQTVRERQVHVLNVLSVLFGKISKTIYYRAKVKKIKSSNVVGDVQMEEINIFFLELRKPLWILKNRWDLVENMKKRFLQP